MYSLYMVTNTINGKRYIGITGNGVSQRICEHFSHAKYTRNKGHFYRAIRKYGRDVFTIMVMETHSTKDTAIAREIELIANIKPEYNSTLGGGGRLGGQMSTRAKKKLAKIHRGNKYRLGKKHTEHTKSLLRKANNTTEALLRWRKFSVMGPAKISRRVICNNDGNIFPSATAAARYYGVQESSLRELCLGQRGRKTVGGLVFTYMDK